ncbi:CBS domain protein [Breoghania corrubedonensis]|uniref:CBS domain protein n=1 Tax=Breoghania corrubedonensis TaxID=665038 RepID=A0A2T5VD35_9HYPH|nr:CBS domain-containing protein [Breoghania corrubedonensis]PTW61646.1 CBS domain protein [Breoghania corrubedonensis]
MTVGAILNEKGNTVVSIRPDATLEDVCKLLLEHRIGAAMVLDKNDDIAGILSERDVVRAVGREGDAALKRAASDVMTTKVETCIEDDTINQAMARMTKGRFRHLPVTRSGRIIGVISIGDVVKWRIEQVEREAEEMRSYIAMA